MAVRSNWKDGKENGLSIKWYSNGQTYEKCNYKDGKYNGLYECWDENGKLMHSLVFDDNRICNNCM